MLIIPQCRFCNANKTTCPIKQTMRKKLQDARITEPLRYICHGWRKHLKYAIGDKIEFDYMIFGHNGYEKAQCVLTGTIVELGKKKSIYIVTITMDEFNKIDPQYTRYHEKVTPYEYWDFDSKEVIRTDYLGAPVNENLILRKLN